MYFYSWKEAVSSECLCNSDLSVKPIYQYTAMDKRVSGSPLFPSYYCVFYRSPQAVYDMSLLLTYIQQCENESGITLINPSTKNGQTILIISLNSQKAWQ